MQNHKKSSTVPTTIRILFKFKTLYKNKYYITIIVLECPKATFPWTANNTG